MLRILIQSKLVSMNDFEEIETAFENASGVDFPTNRVIGEVPNTRNYGILKKKVLELDPKAKLVRGVTLQEAQNFFRN